MNVYFTNLFADKLSFNFVSDKLPSSSLKQQVTILALLALGCLALYYFSVYRFKAQRLDLEDDQEQTKINSLWTQLSPKTQHTPVKEKTQHTPVKEKTQHTPVKEKTEKPQSDTDGKTLSG